MTAEELRDIKEAYPDALYDLVFDESGGLIAVAEKQKEPAPAAEMKD